MNQKTVKHYHNNTEIYTYIKVEVNIKLVKCN